jgi:hypothetical protein
MNYRYHLESPLDCFQRFTDMGSVVYDIDYAPFALNF